MSASSRRTSASRWADGAPAPSRANVGAPARARQRSVRLDAAMAELLRDEAARTGASNGEIIASTLDPLTLTLAARAAAPAPRRQVTFTADDDLVDALDAAAVASSCTRSELVDRLLAIKFRQTL